MTIKKGAPIGNKNASKQSKDLRKNRSFKASDEEWQIISDNAQKAGLTIGAYIRTQLVKTDEHYT